MPPGIEEAYQRDLLRILNLREGKERAIAILRWTFFALRPLTVRELTEVLAVNVDNENSSYPRDELPDTWKEEEMNDEIRRLCGLLIELRAREGQTLPQDQTVHFVHFSVPECLSRATVTNPPCLETIYFSQTVIKNDLLSQICLRYLSYDDLIEEGSVISEAV